MENLPEYTRWTCHSLGQSAKLKGCNDHMVLSGCTTIQIIDYSTQITSSNYNHEGKKLTPSPSPAGWRTHGDLANYNYQQY